MSKEFDEYYFLLQQEGGYLEGTVSRAGVFTFTGTTLEVEALWCYRGHLKEIQHRRKTRLSDDQISHIEIVLEETAWEKAEKVG